MLPYSRPWLDAWAAAAYGPGGFWQRQSPGAHFRTAAGSTAVLGDMIAGVLVDHPEIGAVVDLGAGAGGLLTGLADLRPDLLLAGVDIRERPGGLAERVDWRRDLWDPKTSDWQAGALSLLLAEMSGPVLIMCVEWLDDLPCPVVAGGPGGWREVEADAFGRERAGNWVAGEQLRWLQEWWPAGTRAEVGSTRDDAWASVITALRPYGGLTLMIDYGHRRPDRPARGSLAAYREGRAVPVAPRPDRNLTAAVAVDAVEAAGGRAGGRTLLRARQADILGRNERARSFSARYAGSNRRAASRRDVVLARRDLVGRDRLTDLVDRSERAALRSPYVWGGQWWLLQEVPPGRRMTT